MIRSVPPHKHVLIYPPLSVHHYYRLIIFSPRARAARIESTSNIISRMLRIYVALWLAVGRSVVVVLHMGTYVPGKEIQFPLLTREKAAQPPTTNHYQSQQQQQ